MVSARLPHTTPAYIRSTAIVLALILALGGGVPAVVHTASLTVTTTADELNAGTLRQVYLPLIVRPVPTPYLDQPADGAQIGSLAPLLSWTPQITGTYKLQVATSPAFPPAPTTEVSATTKLRHLQPQVHVTGSNLKFGATTYYWRVGVVFQGSYLFSPIRSFTTPAISTTPLPPAPVLLAPADHAILPARDVVLSWQSMPGALYYRVRIYSPGPTLLDSPGPTLLDSAIVPATTTSYHISGLTAGVSYTWKVRTLDQHAWGNYGAIQTFTAQ